MWGLPCPPIDNKPELLLSLNYILEAWHELHKYRPLHVTGFGATEGRIPLQDVIAWAGFAGRYTRSQQLQLLRLVPELDDVYLKWRSEQKGEAKNP
jgi:hypothetical protein